MELGLINLFSQNSKSNELIAEDTQLIEYIEQQLNVKFAQDKIKDINFLFVHGGGTENTFLDKFDEFKAPIYLIAQDRNNALAASMEIMSYLNDHNIAGRIIHGTKEQIASEIDKIIKIDSTKTFMKNARFARIGKPSDWLIASNIDESLFNIVDISMSEFIDEIELKKYNEDSYTDSFKKLEFDDAEKEKAL